MSVGSPLSWSSHADNTGILDSLILSQSSITPSIPHISETIKWDEQDMRNTAGKAKMNLEVTFFYGPLHINVSALADQQELIYISSVGTLDVVWKTCQ